MNKAPTTEDLAVVAEVGARLRALRRQQNLTQSDIATLLGLAYQSLGMMERGEQNIPLPTYLSWCDALGVEPWELLGWR